jgi:hypothetical protein
MIVRPTEAAIINNFTGNAMNTHTTAVTNSVGVAILHLIKLYFKDSRTKENIDKRYKNFLKEMKSFADNAYCKAAVDYLNTKAGEPLDRWDDIYLYLPADEGDYSIRKIEAPLTLVVPLVWTALKDNDKFVHNYHGSPADQFDQARRNYKNRVHDFFNIFIDNNHELLCHTGLRNDCVFLLNKSYLDIEIIEDDRSTIAATLKDHTNNLFWEHYKKAQTAETRKELTFALFTWMSDYNPAPLLAIVDPDNTALGKITALFIRHGSDPAYIKVEALIKACLPTLNFNYDPQQYPVIKIIENIFDATQEINSELIQSALEKIQQWILLYAVIDDEKTVENINAVYLLYHAQKAFDQHTRLMLEASDAMHENFNQLSDYCHNYFTRINNSELENELPQPDNTFLQIAQQLKESIKNCKSNKMVDFVENFFAGWMLALRDDNLQYQRYLYRFLLDKDFQKKVILTDKEVDEFENQDDSIFQHISYRINRVFLHAFIVENKLWTEKFRSLVNRVYIFIHSRLMQSYDLEHHSLINSSYPHDLLMSIKYIIDDYPPDSGDIHVDIYLPHHITDEYEWRKMTQLMSPEKHLEIYEPQAVRINSLIFKHSDQFRQLDLYDLLILIPEKYRYPFMQLQGFKRFISERIYIEEFEDINIYDICLCKANIPRAVKLVNELIPQEQRLAAWKLILIFPNLDNFYLYLLANNLWQEVLEYLPQDNRLEFLTLFPKYVCEPNSWGKGAWLLLSGSHLITFFRKLRAAQKTIPEHTFLYQSQITAVMNELTLEEKIELLQIISLDLCNYQIFNSLNSNFIDELKNSYGVNNLSLLHHLDIVDKAVDLTKLTESPEYWRENLLQVPNYDRLQYVMISGLECIDGIETLLFTARELESDFTYFASSAKGKSLITAFCLHHDDQKDRIQILKAIQEKERQNFTDVIASLDWERHLADIMSLLPGVGRIDYFYSKVRDPSFDQLCIDGHIPLMTILRTFGTRAISIFFDSMNDRLIRLQALGIINLNGLNNIPNDSIDLQITRKKFISIFIGIYNSLWAGQTSFFKSENWVEERRLSLLPLNEAMKLIFEHANKRGSRSEKTLSLMKKHSHFNLACNKLMNEIYYYSFSNSGLFKRSARIDRPGYFYTVARVERANATHRFEHVYYGSEDTRRDAIFNAFRKKPSNSAIRSSLMINR